MRMHNRRFTRLTNAFSKKFENHAHMVAIYAVWNNFLRIHKTLRVTPAMDADFILAKRGPYKKTAHQISNCDTTYSRDKYTALRSNQNRL